jgi:branched-chain amino acid transport system ATP-binding protein
MLKINQVSAQIAGITVLRNIHTEFSAGQLLAVVGRNGAGKTTLLRAIMGLLPLSAGTITFESTDLSTVAAHNRAGLGLGYAPEDRVMFPTFTVEENLRLPCEVLGIAKEEIDKR